MILAKVNSSYHEKMMNGTQNLIIMAHQKLCQTLLFILDPKNSNKSHKTIKD